MKNKDFAVIILVVLLFLAFIFISGFYAGIGTERNKRNKYDNYNEQTTMQHQSNYTYCPFCGERLEKTW
jgi:hypothetical protein